MQQMYVTELVFWLQCIHYLLFSLRHSFSLFWIAVLPACILPYMVNKGTTKVTFIKKCKLQANTNPLASTAGGRCHGAWCLCWKVPPGKNWKLPAVHSQWEIEIFCPSPKAGLPQAKDETTALAETLRESLVKPYLDDPGPDQQILRRRCMLFSTKWVSLIQNTWEQKCFQF